ncbi:MAG: hypothetical protein ACR2O9_01390 [Alphaproteobacteria bacterium]
MNNRNLKLHERPAPAVGNNKHKRFIQKINEYLSMAGGQANTLDIFYWLNDNTKHGLQINALVNVLSKGPFTTVGIETATNSLGVKRQVNIWKVKVDKVDKRREKYE